MNLSGSMLSSRHRVVISALRWRSALLAENHTAQVQAVDFFRVLQYLRDIVRLVPPVLAVLSGNPLDLPDLPQAASWATSSPLEKRGYRSRQQAPVPGILLGQQLTHSGPGGELHLLRWLGAGGGSGERSAFVGRLSAPGPRRNRACPCPSPPPPAGQAGGIPGTFSR